MISLLPGHILIFLGEKKGRKKTRERGEGKVKAPLKGYSNIFRYSRDLKTRRRRRQRERHKSNSFKNENDNFAPDHAFLYILFLPSLHDGGKFAFQNRLG